MNPGSQSPLAYLNVTTNASDQFIKCFCEEEKLKITFLDSRFLNFSGTGATATRGCWRSRSTGTRTESSTTATVSGQPGTTAVLYKQRQQQVQLQQLQQQRHLQPLPHQSCFQCFRLWKPLCLVWKDMGLNPEFIFVYRHCSKCLKEKNPGFQWLRTQNRCDTTSLPLEPPVPKLLKSYKYRDKWSCSSSAAKKWNLPASALPTVSWSGRKCFLDH